MVDGRTAGTAAAPCAPLRLKSGDIGSWAIDLERPGTVGATQVAWNQGCAGAEED